MLTNQTTREHTMQTTYNPSLIGRKGQTRYGELVKVVGSAHDPTRCTVVPLDLDGMDKRYVETFTPQIIHITFND